MQTTLITNTPTTIASWARMIAQALDACGIDSAQLFSDAGLDLEQTRDPNSRFPSRNMATVWRLAVERSGDPCFALRLPQFVHPSMYSALSMALVSSRNLREVVDRLVRYHRLASDSVDVSIEEEHGLVTIYIDVPPQNEPVAPEALEAFVIASVGLARTIGGTDLSPFEVSFRHSKETGVEQYEAYFQAPVTFGAKKTGQSYRSEDLQAECLHANPALAAELEQWMGKYLARYEKQSLSARVQRWLFERLPGGCPDQKQAAEQFHISPRTLQRKLRQENTTFKDILDQTRRQLALKHIAEDGISIAELTFLLGFSDQSNFTHAFRRWTGLPPQQYRDRSVT